MLRPLILWGGTDIDAKYYAKEPSKFNQNPDKTRDTKEFYMAKEAIKNGQPILGICRGAQLQCILNGGTLIQHSEPEKNNHSLTCLKSYEEPNEFIEIPTAPGAHHQIMEPAGKHVVLGWNPNPTAVWLNDNKWEIRTNCPEIIWWPETKCLGIQAHPEWATKESKFIKYINELLEQLKIDYSFNNAY